MDTRTDIPATIHNWCTTTTDDEFWAVQYSEHCEFVTITLPARYSKEKEEAMKFKLMFNDVTCSISPRLLESFRIFMAGLFSRLSTEVEWIGWLPLSAYEDMISEIEYLQQPRTPTATLSFWLNNMMGHCALDASWIDPSHPEIIAKFKEFESSLNEMKSKLGMSRAYIDLKTRRDNDLEPQSIDKITRGNAYELLTRMKIIQPTLTAYHAEIYRMVTEGKLFTVIPPLFLIHTLRESIRAEHDLESIQY